jgi:protein-disulfide isomerase
MKAYVPLIALIAMGSAGLGVWLGKMSPAADISAATPANGAIEKIVRNYILEHPEILPEAIKRLEEREVSGLLASVREELETPFHGAVGGNTQGDVTLVVFYDYRCPYCHEAKIQVDALIKADSNLRVVYRDYPILDAPGKEPMSRMAASLSLAAAKQNRFNAFHDALFAAGPINQEALVAAARRAGLNESAAVSDSRGGEVAQAINRNIELGRLLGISGTPAYVIGNKVLIGGDKVDGLPNIIAALRG